MRKNPKLDFFESIKQIDIILGLNTDWVRNGALESSFILKGWGVGGFAPVLLYFIRILKQGDSQVSAAVNPASLGHIKQRHITQDLTFHAPQSSLNAFADTTGREGRAYKFMRWAWEGTHSHEQGEGDENRREKKGERRRRKRSEKDKKGTDWSREEREKAPWAMGGASKLPNSHFLRAIQCLTKGLCRCVCQCVCPLEF